MGRDLLQKGNEISLTIRSPSQKISKELVSERKGKKMAVSTLSAGTLTGDTVRNRQDEELGNVEEIMIDLDSGRVSYFVLSAGGFLGVGDKYFAIPWELLEVDTENHDVVVDLSKETVENAPGFDKDNWPDGSDLNWLNDIYTYYGTEPYWAT